MPLSNDERGWVMSGLSGLACIFGASFICIDIIVRQFPGKANFRIQDSDAFLSISLSLSFGVMLFSALYSMLPSSKKALQDGGFSAKEAAWIMIACFIGGIVGIQVISNALHRFVPHDIVDCEHTHQDDDGDPKESGDGHDDDHDHDPNHDHNHAAVHQHDHQDSGIEGGPRRPKLRGANSQRRRTMAGHMPPLSSKRTPSYRSMSYFRSAPQDSVTASPEPGVPEMEQPFQPPTQLGSNPRRPSLQQRITTSLSTLTSGKNPPGRCDGPCYGFSEVCGPECFKNVNPRGGRYVGGSTRPLAGRNATATETTPLLHDITEEELHRPHTQAGAEGAAARQHTNSEGLHSQPSNDSLATTSANADNDDTNNLHKMPTQDSDVEGQPEHHHHHVPKNAFLSIGLQTSIAIALHKLPEGFITYATNHANPKLGFSVFLALFIHNITEGFALALPLYLAINNRMKAMLISFVLGGLSQPLGAGVAALWFKLAGKSNWAPSEAVYGGMFAVTAGIMASVALQLFSESLDLTHSKVLCMVGAFAGMTILGISNALTA